MMAMVSVVHHIRKLGSSSADDGNDSDGADAAGGGNGGGGGGSSSSGGGIPIRFTGIHCTYICTPVSDYEY